MSSLPANPDHHGAFSSENLPQVVVRAEKVFLCSSCGTLVEIPADVVGKLGWAEQPPRQQPRAEEVAATDTTPPTNEDALPAHAPGKQTKEPRTTTEMRCRQPNPRRCVTTSHATWIGKAVDGLDVPSGKQLDQAFKWVTFHLKVLDRQNDEIKRLKKLLKKSSTQSVPCPRPPEDASSTSVPKSTAKKEHAKPRPAQADLGVAPSRDNQTERGPP